MCAVSILVMAASRMTQTALRRSAPHAGQCLKNDHPNKSVGNKLHCPYNVVLAELSPAHNTNAS